MKYMLLIHSGGDSWSRFESLPEEDKRAILGEYLELANVLGVLSGHQLQPTDTARPSASRTARR